MNGIVTIVADAKRVLASTGEPYRAEPYATEAATLTAVPYYAWNNRGPNRMLVWLPES